MSLVAALFPALLLGLQLTLEFVLIAMITSEFGASTAAIYFTTIAQLALWNLICTSGFQDYLIVTRMTGTKRYLRLSVVGLTFASALAATVLEFEYVLGLILSTTIVLLGKWVSALIRISDHVLAAISIEATAAVIIKLCAILFLIHSSVSALDLKLLSYFISVMPALLAAIAGLIYCRLNRCFYPYYTQEVSAGTSMIAKLYGLKMAGQLYRKADVLIVDMFFPPASVTAYAIIKQLISASYKISGKIFAQVAIVQAKLAENRKRESRKGINKNFYMSSIAMGVIALALYLILILTNFSKLDQVTKILDENGFLYLSLFINYLILTRTNLFAQVLKAWGMAGSILLYSIFLSIFQIISLFFSSLLINNIVFAVWINTIVSAIYFFPMMKKLYEKHAQ